MIGLHLDTAATAPLPLLADEEHALPANAALTYGSISATPPVNRLATHAATGYRMLRGRSPLSMKGLRSPARCRSQT